MKIKHTLHTAIYSLVIQKSRTLLTILGIIIGVAAIIVVMSLGKGAQSLILNEINSLGAETVVVRGGNEIYQPLQNLTQKDYENILKQGNLPNMVQAVPMVLVNESVSAGTKSIRPIIVGSKAEFLIDIFNIYPAEGVPFTDDDVNSRSRVVLIGEDIKNELFENENNVIGQSIRIADQRFRIGGVFPRSGQVLFFNIDELVVVPYTSAQTYLTGESNFIEIILKADDASNVDKLAHDLEILIRESRNLDPSEENDFIINTQQALVDQVSTIITALTAFLSAVVAISLVVGGVGVMNIMLVSVTERTKEIGLRKALGATKKDILKQFLVESVILTSIGGVLGIIIGTIISISISVYLTQSLVQNWQFTFPVSAAFMGIGVSAVVGLIFGIYPASKAASKNPIEALKYE